MLVANAPQVGRTLGINGVYGNMGLAFSALLAGAMADTFGWRWAFIATGALGAVWLSFWILLPRSTGKLAPPARDDAPDRNIGAFLKLAADRRTWAVALGKFLTDFVWVFLLFWGPDLFHKMFGLNTVGLSLPVAMVFLMAGAGSLFAGPLSSWLLGKGKSFNLARKTPMLIAAVLAVPVFAVIWAPNVWVAAGLLGLTLAAHQMFSTSLFGLATDVFPSRMVGLVIGMAATFAGFSGLALNEYTGWVLDHGGSYAPMLAICAGAKVIAVIVVHVCVPNIDAARAAHVSAAE